MRVYRETFDDGPGGWYGWCVDGASALEMRESCAVSRSPWWVDYNHAPPGAGYLHILYALNTRVNDECEAVSGRNRFIAGGYPRDFTNAELTLRLKGNVTLSGSQLVLLVQSDITEPVRTRVNSVLTAQPLAIGENWSEQTIRCVPDNGQWTCLGSRHDRFATYGSGPIAPVLREVTCDIILVLFPLRIEPLAPLGPDAGDRHLLRADRDYPVDRARLPAGEVWLDEITIVFAT